MGSISREHFKTLLLSVKGLPVCSHMQRLLHPSGSLRTGPIPVTQSQWGKHFKLNLNHQYLTQPLPTPHPPRLYTFLQLHTNRTLTHRCYIHSLTRTQAQDSRHTLYFFHIHTAHPALFHSRNTAAHRMPEHIVHKPSASPRNPCNAHT